MALDTFVAPWTGDAYRHIPERARYHVLDFSRAGLGSDNRWNVPGEPTLYLAGDREVAIEELARHIGRDRPPAVGARVLQRRLYRLQVNLEAVLDLGQPGAWQALNLPNAPACFLDRNVARAVAHDVRVTTSVQAMRVPSVAFLDDLQRWILVLFLEKLPVNPEQYILACTPDAAFSI